MAARVLFQLHSRRTCAKACRSIVPRSVEIAPGGLWGRSHRSVGGIAGRPRANGVRAQGALLGLCPLVAVVVGGFWIFSGFVVHTARGAAMTSERGFRYRLRATDGIWRFKHRPVLVAFDLLALVVLVFCA